jgi:hypothetical protein
MRRILSEGDRWTMKWSVGSGGGVGERVIPHPSGTGIGNREGVDVFFGGGGGGGCGIGGGLAQPSGGGVGCILQTTKDD